MSDPSIVMFDQVQSCQTKYSQLEPGIVMFDPGILKSDPGIVMSDQVQSCLTRYSQVEPGIVMSDPGI